jgi:hypothetical protein
VSRRFLEPRCEASEAFQVVEEDLYHVSHTICLAIESWSLLSTWAWVDHSRHATFTDTCSDSIGVVTRVCYHLLPSRVLGDYRFRNGRFMLLARRKLDVQRTSLRVDERMHFRADATS